MISDAAARRERLVEVFKEAESCALCPLAETRTRVVFGAGHADADLMFVGEAPGAEEDRTGLPFVGRAGALLNELLAAIELSREDVFITNVLKSRPPGNRDPLPNEIEACRPYLLSQIELIRPRVIATLGNFATKLITGSQTGITRVHGAPQPHTIAGVALAVMPLFHPAAALRTPALRETLRKDFESLQALLAERPAAHAAGGTPGRSAPDSEDQLGLFGS